MKARIKTQQEITKEAVEDYLNKEWKDKIINERATASRRVLKVMMLSLNELYHFGPKRNRQVCDRISEIIEDDLKKVDNDNGDFWYYIDTQLQRINCSIFPFEDEYTKDKSKKGD